MRELVSVLRDVRDKLIGLYALSTATIYLGFGTIVGLNIMLDTLTYSRLPQPLSGAVTGVFWGVAVLLLIVISLRTFGKPISMYKEVLRSRRLEEGKPRFEGRVKALLIAFMWLTLFLVGGLLGWYLSDAGVIEEYYSAQFGLLLALCLGNIIIAILTRERKPLACGISLGLSTALLPFTGSFSSAWTYTSSIIIVTYNLTGLAYMIEATRLVIGKKVAR